MSEAEAREYLAQLGLTVPDFILTALMAQVGSISTCLAQYPAETQTLIQSYLTGLLAISAGGRRVTSQGAPSGASQSYSYGTITEQMRQLKASLRILDTEGCTKGLIPAEPGPNAAMYVVKGRNCE